MERMITQRYSLQIVFFCVLCLRYHKDKYTTIEGACMMILYLIFSFSQQFLRVWEDACQWNGNSVMVIPKGIYKLNPVKFTGPCKGSIAVQIIGDLKASTDISVNPWIDFQHVDRLLVQGSGTVDGQGASIWSKYGCKHYQKDCQPLPIVSHCNKILLVILNLSFVIAAYSELLYISFF